MTEEMNPLDQELTEEIDAVQTEEKSQTVEAAAAVCPVVALRGAVTVSYTHLDVYKRQGHMIMKFLKDKGRSPLSEADYAGFLEDVYEQTDRYLGKFLHYLDEGWTIFIVSDHAQVCPEYDPPLIGEGNAVNVRLLQELGFTALKHDENGEELREIDWEKTKAVNIGMNIWLNIKGRDKFGCVDPKDQYQVEEEIMTALYGYRDPQSSQRVIALALRNKDAILLGLGGPECGDIIIWLAAGYNYDHADSLSTTYGYAGTSVSPIFIAAGKGIRQGLSLIHISLISS